MTAGGGSVVQVLLDDASNGGTWPYDISAYVREVDGFSVSRGRADELSAVSAGTLSLTLDNSDGRFTVGTTGGGYGAVNLDRGIRVAETTPTPANTNLIGPAGADFETGTVGSWTASGSATLANSTTRAVSGTHSMLITWPTGGLPGANLTIGGLTVGQTYTAQAWLWSAAGVPAVGLSWRGNSVSTTAANAGAWTLLTVSGVATATSHTLQVFSGSTTSGQQTWVDAVMLNLGSAPGAFNTLTPATVTRFTGFVQAWPVNFPDGSDLDARVQIAAVDAMDRWGRRTLRSVIEEELSILAPVATYPLGEPAGATSVADTSGNAAPMLQSVGAGTAIVFGTATGPGTDGFTAAKFAGSGKFLQGPLPSTMGTNYSVQIYFSTTNTSGGSIFSLLDQSGTAITTVSVSGSGLSVGAATAAGGWCDGNTHSLLVTVATGTAKAYVDGSLQLTTTVPSSAPGTLQLGGPVIVGLSLFGIQGVLAQASVFNTTLGATDALNLAFAGSTGFAGELGPSRISRLVKYEGTVTSTSMDAGLTAIPFVDLTGKTVSDAIQEVVDAEVGKVYIDGQGRAAFHNRQRAAGKITPDLSGSTATSLIDPGLQAVVDMANVINYATGRRDADDTAVTQVTSSPTSITHHGRYPQDYTLLVTTDAEVADRIGWIVNAHAEPAPRFPTLSLDLFTADPTVQQAALALDLDSRIRVTGLPSQTPGGTTADLVVEGFTETRTKTEWSLTINASAWSLVQAGVLDDPTYGVLNSTMRLAI